MVSVLNRLTSYSYGLIIFLENLFEVELNSVVKKMKCHIIFVPFTGCF